MFAFRRGRLPLLIPLALAVAFGYLLAGGIGSAVGALLFIPFFIMKVVFMMMFFGVMFRLFAHKTGGPRWHDHHHYRHHHQGRWSQSDTEADGESSSEQEDRDWEDALRAAKREIDKLFPNPGDRPEDREE